MCLILFFFFPQKAEALLVAAWKTTENLSRILLLHIILKTPHYGTCADNDLSLLFTLSAETAGPLFKACLD